MQLKTDFVGEMCVDFQRLHQNVPTEYTLREKPKN